MLGPEVCLAAGLCSSEWRCARHLSSVVRFGCSSNHLSVHFLRVVTTTGTAVWLLWLNRFRIVLVALLDREGRWFMTCLWESCRHWVIECNQLTISVLCSVSETAAFVCARVPVWLTCPGLVIMLPVYAGLVMARIRSVGGCVRDTAHGPIVCGVVVDYPPDPS